MISFFKFKFNNNDITVFNSDGKSIKLPKSFIKEKYNSTILLENLGKDSTLFNPAVGTNFIYKISHP